MCYSQWIGWHHIVHRFTSQVVMETSRGTSLPVLGCVLAIVHVGMDGYLIWCFAW